MYLLDSDALITPSNRWYGLDFCPAYWDWLIEACKTGVVASTIEVQKEIKKRETEPQKALYRWVRGLGSELFQEPTYQIQHLTEVALQVRHVLSYTDAAKDTFLTIDNGPADPHLVAEALARGKDETIIVSLEVTGNPKSARPASQKRVKLYDICEGLGISCIQTYEMLQRESRSSDSRRWSDPRVILPIS